MKLYRKIMDNRNFLAIDKNYTKILGLTASVLYSELCKTHDWMLDIGKLRNDAFLFQANEFQQEFNVNRHEYDRSVKLLEEKGLIQRLKLTRGTKWWYKINAFGSVMGDNTSVMGDNTSVMGDTTSVMGDTPIGTLKDTYYNNIPPAKADLAPQAEARVLSVTDFNTVDEYLAYVRIQERKKLDIQQDLGVEFTDTKQDIKAKAKVARKTRSKKQDIQPTDKWSSFLSFIKDEFSILYPKHRNKAAAIKSSLEFALDPSNESLTDIEIENIVKQIKNHYLVYCEQNEFAVGPARYINDRMWTVKLENSKPDYTESKIYTTDW